MKVDEADNGAEAPGLRPLDAAAVPAVKTLIAEGVLELYGDLEFLPKDREGLLRHYESIGYLRDLDDHASVIGSAAWAG
jgi:hypothetical protein